VPGVGVATLVAVGGDKTDAPNALATSIRPNGLPATGSTVARIWFDASTLFFPLATSRAANPAVSAAAADVPVTERYPPPDCVV
jgi:hypothetical protein